MIALGQPDLFTKRIRAGPQPKEREIQIQLIRLLYKYRGLSPGWVCFHIPNGELRSAKTGALLKDMGERPGVLDLEFISPVGKVYFLELKRGRARLTEAQEAFVKEMEACGIECAVAGSLKAAIDQLKAWGACRVTVSV